MKALISPNELREAGFRVAEVSSQEFEVAHPMFWVDCTSDIAADKFWFDPSDQAIKAVPEPEPEPEQPVVEGAQPL